MAPGIPLEKHIRMYLEKNLSLEIFERGWGFEGTLIIQLKLNGEVIGKSYAIGNDIKWGQDRGHGGGYYVKDVDMTVHPLSDEDEK